MIAFAVAFALAAATTASAYHTHFVRDNCNTHKARKISAQTRYSSLAYAYTGRFEGYQWGGGCWNDNNIDDSPGDPTEDPNTGGEGPDCSGLVFKSWFESDDRTDTRFWHRPLLTADHGPYTAGDFKAGGGDPNITYPKRSLIPGDALASSTHIALVYSPNGDGTDDVIEAKGEAYGTGVWTRTYRGSSQYGGVRRVGWSG